MRNLHDCRVVVTDRNFIFWHGDSPWADDGQKITKQPNCSFELFIRRGDKQAVSFIISALPP